MSQLFGFPSGLSGGSKETSHGTVHSTQKSTAYDSHFNTNYNSDFNTDVSTDHTSTWNTIGGFSADIDDSALPRFYGGGDSASGVVGNHQSLMLTTKYWNKNGGYIEIKFDGIKGPRYQSQRPYMFYSNYNPPATQDYKATFYFGPGAPATDQYTQHYMASINDVSVHDVVDGCTSITDSYGNVLPYGGDKWSDVLDNFCLWIIDYDAIAQNYPSTSTYGSPTKGRWTGNNLYPNHPSRYPTHTNRLELLPQDWSTSSWRYHNVDCDVHFQLMRRQLYFAKFVLDKYKHRPEISEHYKKIDFSPLNPFNAYAGNSVTLGEYDCFFAYSNWSGGGWFPLSWWAANLDDCYNTGGYTYSNPAIGLPQGGSIDATQLYSDYVGYYPRMNLDWNWQGEQYGADNQWMAPTRGGRCVSYTGGGFEYQRSLQTSYSSSRTTQKITTRNTDRSTLRSTTKNTATDTNYTTEYITYG